jgi:hypothetical protein
MLFNMNVSLLTDKTRLQEIYDLRLKAYEQSPYSKYINRQKYSSGFFDRLDSFDTTHHYIIEEDNKIIGSTRITVINNLAELQENLQDLNLPQTRPFAFCSRTVVDPNFRSIEALSKLDQATMQFINSDPSIKFALCYLPSKRIKAAEKLGFQQIGTIDYDWGNLEIIKVGAFIYKKSDRSY